MKVDEGCPFCKLLDRRRRTTVQPGLDREFSVSLNEIEYYRGGRVPSSYQNFEGQKLNFCPVCGKEVIF